MRSKRPRSGNAAGGPGDLRRIAKYIHERGEWPAFVWNHEALASPLAAIRHRQGRLVGRMEALGFDLRAEAVLQTLTETDLSRPTERIG